MHASTSNEVIHMYEEVLRLDPADIEATFNLGLAYLQ